MTLPQRGEVWLADCGLAAKTRPVVVVSIPFKDADRALITVVPHTTTLVGSQFEVRLPLRWLERGAFNIQAVFPLAPPRFIHRLGVLPLEQLRQIELAIKQWEGLT